LGTSRKEIYEENQSYYENYYNMHKELSKKELEQYYKKYPT